MAEDWDRPTTSTRDYDELGRRLQSWLETKLPDGAHPELSGLDVPSSNGMSSETVLFDLTVQEGGRSSNGSFVARMAPEQSAVPVFPSYDLGKQFRVMQLVAELTSVPVPPARWIELDPDPLGSPFFVMERVEGHVPPDVMPYNFGSWVTEADDAQLARMQESSVAVLAGLHTLDTGSADLSFLEFDRPEPTALRRHVAEQWDYYRWVSQEQRHPLLERAFAWLDDHWPDDDGDSVLSWGDARIGNMLYRDFEPVGVLDWEMAAVGPRELDLGWMIFLHRFFEDIAAQMDLPGLPSFLRRDDVASTYERLTGHAPRDLDFYTLYAALRHGIVMSRVTQRSIMFGEAERPEDPDDMIMHRASIEAMLDGTYWDDLDAPRAQPTPSP
jgi:aminoglycoside phosphotransferase (APT) family kinase protein